MHDKRVYNQVVKMSSMLIRPGGPVIRDNIVSRIRRVTREEECG